MSKPVGQKSIHTEQSDREKRKRGDHETHEGSFAFDVNYKM